jgi:Na+/proline symporter
LVFSGVLLYREIAPHMSFLDTLFFAGEMGRMQVLDFSFSATERYTVWSGLTGGFFLSLSYFGTDQSQVQRYLGGKSVDESRAGLLFNAVLKIPMQFSILFIGVLVFVFFTIERPPLHFNQAAVAKLSPEAAAKVADLESDFTKVHADIQLSRENWLSDRSRTAELKKSMMAEQLLRQEVVDIIELEQVKAKDTNYVFLYFVLQHLPKGVVGLIIAMILSAAMSSTAGELNALTTTTVVDYHRRLGGGGAPMTVNRLYTLFWGVLAIIFALSASLFDNLIEMVNLLGSLFYGTILGVFLVAFFLKKVKAKAVFYAALASQVSILVIHSLTYLEWISGVGYLWYNLIGCVFVVVLSSAQTPRKV